MPLLLPLLVFAASGCSRPTHDAGKEIRGHWEGIIDLGSRPTPIVLHIDADRWGGLSATLDLPADFRRRVPLDQIDFENRRLTLRLEGLQASFEGLSDSTGSSIEGSWTQWGLEYPITFLRVDSLFVKSTDYTYERPPKLEDGWDTSDPEPLGLDPDRLGELVVSIRSGLYKLVNGIVIVKDGQLVLEEYATHYYGRDYEHNVTSVAKSFCSAIVGIAVDHGQIDDLDRPVASYLADYTSPRSWDEKKKRMSLRHLLTMSSGLACSNLDPSSPGHPHKMFATSDWFRFLLDLPMDAEPGDRFSYCEGNAMLLGEVVRVATGRSADAFGHEHLFKPLGIEDYHWEHSARGRVLTGTSLHIRARDMAKFGQLYLDTGLWNGRRILSAEWIRESITRRFDTDLFGGYGYLWWLETYQGPHGQVDAFSAIGNGGQKIIVLPDLRMVVVFTCTAYNRDYAFRQIDEMMEKHILPALRVG